MPFALFGETIFSSKLDSENPAIGVIIAGSSCSLQAAPSWATEYTNGFMTSGSSGKATINLETAISLSDYTDVKLTIHWGAANSRPLKVAINSGSATQIHAALDASERSKVLEDTYSITATSSISSISLSSASGGNVYFFDISITGTRTTPLPSNTKTVCLNPDVYGWKIGNERILSRLAWSI